MSTGIIGYGRFGRALGGLLDDSRRPWIAVDPAADVPTGHRAATLKSLAQRAATIVIAVPVPAIRGVVKALAPLLRSDQLVLDVGSVKMGPETALRETLETRVPWVATHPLFGPASLARGERPLRVVVCPNPDQPAATARAGAFFAELGCEVTYIDAKTHDRAMADTHVLAFFVAKALLDIGAEDHPLAPPSFQAMSRTIDAVRADAGHLFAAIQGENSFAAEARARLLQALGALDEQLAQPPERRDATSLAIPDLGAAAPDLLQTRDLIDEVDRELVRLLARRAQLSARAGRAKTGAAIRDPAREAQMLEDRQSWAESERLESAGVREIFEAVLKSSRALQQKQRVTG